jgi:hypothetical protein
MLRGQRRRPQSSQQAQPQAVVPQLAIHRLKDMTMADSHNAVQQFMLKYPRPIGAVLGLLGAAFCYWMIVQPIQQAETGKPEIKLSLKGGTLGVVLIVFGLTYAVFGVRFARIFQPSAEESKAPAYTVGILLAILALGIYFALKSYLESKGYVFKS